MPNNAHRTNADTVINTYLVLTLLSTLASSLIWGINTLFLLNAGLTIAQAFAANAFFTAGQVLFEVPTGVVADLRGRRLSYLLGTVTLLATTIAYYVLWATNGSFLLWALVSILLGLGFTFFSGATEAWLVDALQSTGSKRPLESVFAKGQMVSGIAMLTGTVAGGIIAQVTTIGVPYLLRAVLLGATFIVARVLMHDVGFSPVHYPSIKAGVRQNLSESINYGLKNRPVRWVMLAAPFGMGVSVYVFYALQPYLLELYGDSEAYGIAGLAAAIVAGAQIAGGLSVSFVRRLFALRTSIMIGGSMVGVLCLFAFGLLSSFWIALAVIVLWSIAFAAMMPVQQAFLNDLIPSKQRATVLSFNSLMSSLGGTVSQPTLGRIADVYGYSASYFVSGSLQLLVVPFLLLAKRERVSADRIKHEPQ